MGLDVGGLPAPSFDRSRVTGAEQSVVCRSSTGPCANTVTLPDNSAPHDALSAADRTMTLVGTLPW